jgi:hypothetical protein
LPLDAIQATSNHSLLLQAAIEEQRIQQRAAQLDETNRASSTLATRGSLPTYDHQTRAGSFDLSGSHIRKMMHRYRMDSFKFEQLQSLPMSELSSEEKAFVLYLQRNPYYFNKFANTISKLDTNSAENARILAELSRRSVNLTHSDLAYIRAVLLEEETKENKVKVNSLSTKTSPNIQEMAALMHRMSEQMHPLLTGQLPVKQPPITYDQLMTLDIGSFGLTPIEQERLDFLRSSSVASMLKQIALDADSHRFITVDVLRILSSLISNPLIYGNVPITFFRTPAESHLSPEEETQPLDVVAVVKKTDIHSPASSVRNRCWLMASDIQAICYRLSEDGTVSLEQLRSYEALNAREARAVNLLRQHGIFHRLADLDHHNETLCDGDIRLAVAEKTLVLSDDSMVLVILP